MSLLATVDSAGVLIQTFDYERAQMFEDETNEYKWSDPAYEVASLVEPGWNFVTTVGCNYGDDRDLTTV